MQISDVRQAAVRERGKRNDDAGKRRLKMGEGGLGSFRTQRAVVEVASLTSALMPWGACRYCSFD